MKIAIINIGNELLIGQTLNSHHQWLAQKCALNGWTVDHQQTIKDSPDDIISALKQTMPAFDVVITTGGLGPTSDDITRSVVSDYFNSPLVRSHKIEERIRHYFAKRKRVMPDSVLIQADIPENSTVFENDFGTAPGLGLLYENHDSWLIMLPGPPRELHPMYEHKIEPFLREIDKEANTYHCRIIRTVGVGESKAQEMIEPKLADFLNQGLDIGYCARTGEVDIRISSRNQETSKLVDNTITKIRSILGDSVIGEGEIELEEVLVKALVSKKKSVATAESCTGGSLAHRITQVPGASEIFLGGAITYSNQEKIRQLKVKSETIAHFGAVSAQVAEEMAEGIKRETGADYGLSTTGIAGPSGGSKDKPVGSVFMALAGPGKTEVYHRINAFDRTTFKFVTTQQIMDRLRLALLHSD